MLTGRRRFHAYTSSKQENDRRVVESPQDVEGTHVRDRTDARPALRDGPAARHSGPLEDDEGTASAGTVALAGFPVGHPVGPSGSRDYSGLSTGAAAVHLSGHEAHVHHRRPGAKRFVA
jgi:hypothetical protein